MDFFPKMWPRRDVFFMNLNINYGAQLIIRISSKTQDSPVYIITALRSKDLARILDLGMKGTFEDIKNNTLILNVGKLRTRESKEFSKVTQV